MNTPRGRPKQDEKERFMKYVAEQGDCWIWTGCKLFNGPNGIFSFRGKQWQAHRVSYALFVGEIPPGTDVRRKCDTEGCVRPEHLVAASQYDAIERIHAPERGLGHAAATDVAVAIGKKDAQEVRGVVRQRGKRLRRGIRVQ